ncbi:MAG: type 4a pilus biogenesis protein PilO [Neisseria sp.]|nr:type 4a pilus biogenesis protein PilO [Neisseria sp.]
MASKSLDLKELYLQGTPVKLLFALLVVLLILVLGYFLLYSGQWSELQRQEQKEVELRQDFSTKAAMAARLPILKEELAQLQESFAILLKQLPTDAEVPNLIQELNQAGSNNSLQMASTTPQASKPDGPVEILPYSISTKGSYEQFAKFSKDVGGLSRIVVLDALNISADKDGKLTMNARANTYKAAIGATATDAAAAK